MSRAVVVMVVTWCVAAALLGAGHVAAAEPKAAVLSGVLPQGATLFADSAPGAAQAGQLKPGTRVALFPEMSTDEFWFAMPEGAVDSAAQGWIPVAGVKLVEAQLGDVPVGHWAGDAVRRLSDEGVVDFPKGGFQGDKVVTRYDLAVTMNRYLDKMTQYKASILDAIEALPLDKQLDPEQAGRVDRLVRILERAEATEKGLKGQVTALTERVERESQRVDVVEEAQRTQGDDLQKLQGKVGRLDGLQNTLATLERRLAKLEAADGPSTPRTPLPPAGLDGLRRELKDMRKRLEHLETPRTVASAAEEPIQPQVIEITRNSPDPVVTAVTEPEPAATADDEPTLAEPAAEPAADEAPAEKAELPEPAAADVFVQAAATAPAADAEPAARPGESSEEQDFSVTAEDFDESFQPGVVSEDELKRSADTAHDALRAALRKGLQGPPTTAQSPAPAVAQLSTRAAPSPALVQSLTKQLGQISQTLRSLDGRVDTIEKGML